MTDKTHDAEILETTPNIPQNSSQWKEKISAFFAPCIPLWQAIVAFAQTSIGIVIGVIVILATILNLLCFHSHHRDFDQRGSRHMQRNTNFHDDFRPMR